MKRGMIKGLLLSVIGLFLLLPAISEDRAPIPKISSAPLTGDQIAVYRTVLEDWMNGSDKPLNLADKTEPLDPRSLDEACTNGIELQVPRDRSPIVHHLNPVLAFRPGMVLVASDQQGKKIKENDPQKLVKQAVEGHEDVTDKQLDHSVQRAVNTGLFTLTEIVFDKKHDHAVVAYSFVCGLLCGNGKTLFLRKVNGKWLISKMCVEWIA